MSQVVIVSGPSGVGKSSVCRALAERYDRTVHLETDLFFEAIRMGRINPMREESDRQNQMISRAVARAATAYARELYAVFIDGVIGPHLLPIYVEELRQASVPVQFVLLRTGIDLALERVAPREAQRRMIEQQQRHLHEQFERYGAFAGCRFETDGMSPDAIADLVMEACGRGDCLVWRPD